MRTEIDNACSECHNEIYEYLDGFDKNYQRLQNNLNSYKREKYNIVEKVDYSDSYHLEERLVVK